MKMYIKIMSFMRITKYEKIDLTCFFLFQVFENKI